MKYIIFTLLALLLITLSSMAHAVEATFTAKTRIVQCGTVKTIHTMCPKEPLCCEVMEKMRQRVFLQDWAAEKRTEELFKMYFQTEDQYTETIEVYDVNDNGTVDHVTNYKLFE